MNPLFYGIRTRIRPSKVHPTTCRVQIIIRFADGKRYSFTIPRVFDTEEVKKFNNRTHPLDTSDFDYQLWKTLRGWAIDCDDAVRDMVLENPERLSNETIKHRTLFNNALRKQGLRDFTISNIYSDPRAKEGENHE